MKKNEEYILRNYAALPTLTQPYTMVKKILTDGFGYQLFVSMYLRGKTRVNVLLYAFFLAENLFLN